MKKIICSGKIMSLVMFILVCTSLLFYFLIGDGSLFASNLNNRIRQEKGMSVEEFKKRVSNKNKIVLVYFHADWCVPCIKLKSEMIALENETKSYCEVLKINTDDNPLIEDYLEINTLPMFVIYKNGNKSFENIGLMTKMQIQSKLEMFK